MGVRVLTTVLFPGDRKGEGSDVRDMLQEGVGKRNKVL